MYVKIGSGLMEHRADEIPEGKDFGNLLRCYRHEVLYDDSGPERKIREHFFLVESRHMDDSVYVTSPEEYGDVLFHDPSLPQDYSKGPYMWTHNSECELVKPTNANMKGLLENDKWELPRPI